jgi:hypothetical protein
MTNGTRWNLDLADTFQSCNYGIRELAPRECFMGLELAYTCDPNWGTLGLKNLLWICWWSSWKGEEMVRRMNLSTLKWAGKLVKAQVLEHVGIFSSREFCFISVSARQQLLEDIGR